MCESAWIKCAVFGSFVRAWLKSAILVCECEVGLRLPSEDVCVGLDKLCLFGLYVPVWLVHTVLALVSELNLGLPSQFQARSRPYRSLNVGAGFRMCDAIFPSIHNPPKCCKIQIFHPLASLKMSTWILLSFQF